MNENSFNYWITPICAIVIVVMMLIIVVDARANTTERYIEPKVIIPKTISDKNPYVEFCNSDTDFYPEKLIQNDTHKFDHQYCIWNPK